MARLPREQLVQRPPRISKPGRACKFQRMLRPSKAVMPSSWARQEAQKKSPECSRRNVSARPSSVTLTPPAGPRDPTTDSSATSVDDVVLLLEWLDRLYRLSDYKRRSTPRARSLAPR